MFSPMLSKIHQKRGRVAVPSPAPAQRTGAGRSTLDHRIKRGFMT
jgi:hypothetical protein